MFIDGEIQLPNDDDWNGESFAQLTDPQKEAFWDYKIVVRFLRRTNDAEIRDLFERLNTNNIALNDQEIRNAKYRGKFKELALRLADDPILQRIGLFTPRDVRRMLDVEFVSELLVLVIHGISNKKDLVDEFYAMYDEELPDEAQFEADFMTVIGLLWSIYDSTQAASFKTKSNFYSLFGCMLQYHRTTGRKALARPDEVRDKLLGIITAAREEKFDLLRPEVGGYADAVARAASDKGRRQRREEILWGTLRTIEGIR